MCMMAFLLARMDIIWVVCRHSVCLHMCVCVCQCTHVFFVDQWHSQGIYGRVWLSPHQSELSVETNAYLRTTINHLFSFAPVWNILATPIYVQGLATPPSVSLVPRPSQFLILHAKNGRAWYVKSRDGERRREKVQNTSQVEGHRACECYSSQMTRDMEIPLSYEWKMILRRLRLYAYSW